MGLRLSDLLTKVNMSLIHKTLKKNIEANKKFFENSEEIVFDYLTFIENMEYYFDQINYKSKINSDYRNQLLPYIDLAEFSLYNHLNVANTLHILFKDNKPWSWVDEFSGLHTGLTTILLYKNLTQTLESIIVLLINGFESQAMQIFRGYIEINSTLCTFLLDRKFAKLYMSSPKDVEEYRKFWYRNLKPEKIKNKLKALKVEVEKNKTKSGIKYPELIPPTEVLFSEWRNKIDKITSNYVHSNINILLNHSFDKKVNGYNISISNYKSSHFNSSLVNIIEYSILANDTFIHLLNFHATPKNEKSIDFINLNCVTTYLDLTFDGLYEFSKSETK